MVVFGKENHTYTLYCNGVAIDYYVLKSGNDVATWEVDSPENNQYLVTKSDVSDVTVITIEIITEKGFDLQVKEVKCWWADIKINNETSIDTQLENVSDADRIDKLLNGAGLEESAEKILEKVTNESNLVSQSFIHKKDSEPNIFKESDVKETNTGETGFLNSIYNYIKDKKDSVYMKKIGETNDDLVGTNGYEEVNKSALSDEGINVDAEITYDTMDVLKKSRKEKYCTIKQTKSVNYGIPSGDYELSGVLALLKDSKGDPIEYRDIYDRNNSDNSTIAPGEMLVNGAEMTFELLDSSENTEGLSDVMRYLLYLYSGNDYGITNANFGMFNDLSFGGLSGSSMEEKAWFALKNAGIKNEYAIAGAMGNFFAESGFKSNNLEEKYNKLLVYTDEEYTKNVNDGTYTKQQFVNDKAGYGLMQWTDITRKEGLYNYAKSKGVSIDDEDMQIEYMIAEITGTGPAVGYTNRIGTSGYDKWINSKSTDEAAKIFCNVFESPSTPNMEQRQNKAKEYYDLYHGKNYTGATGEKICEAASNILNYTVSNNYTYNSGVPNYKFNNGPGITGMKNQKGVCCATYVAWTLVESGVVSAEYIDTLYFRGATELGNGLKKIFKTVSKENMQAGDIVVWPGHHTQIYAGNGYWYNGGSDGKNPVVYSKYDAIEYFEKSCGWKSYYILRPTQQ